MSWARAGSSPYCGAVARLACPRTHAAAGAWVVRLEGWSSIRPVASGLRANRTSLDR